MQTASQISNALNKRKSTRVKLEKKCKMSYSIPFKIPISIEPLTII